MQERFAPSGYYATSAFTVSLDDVDEVDHRVRRHQARPVLRIATTDAAGTPMPGSCWFVRITGTTEGGWNACDADDGSEDGVTRYLDMDAGDYDLIQLSAPQGIDRIDDTTFAMPGDQDKTLTYALAPAVPPANTVAPSVAGGHAVGDELTGSPGTWTGSREIDYYDAWERCDLDGTGCVAAEGYDETYTVTAGDAGKALRYSVVATNDGGRVAAYSPLHPISSLDVPEPTAGAEHHRLGLARPAPHRRPGRVDERAHLHLPVAALRGRAARTSRTPPAPPTAPAARTPISASASSSRRTTARVSAARPPRRPTRSTTPPTTRCARPPPARPPRTRRWRPSRATGRRTTAG